MEFYVPSESSISSHFNRSLLKSGLGVKRSACHHQGASIYSHHLLIFSLFVFHAFPSVSFDPVLHPRDKAEVALLEFCFLNGLVCCVYCLSFCRAELKHNIMLHWAHGKWWFLGSS